MLCVLIRIASYNYCEGNKKSLNYRYLLPDLAPWLTLSGSNYPCLEQFSMVPKMFEPLKFDCMYTMWAYRINLETKCVSSEIKHIIIITVMSPFPGNCLTRVILSLAEYSESKAQYTCVDLHAWVSKCSFCLAFRSKLFKTNNVIS